MSDLLRPHDAALERLRALHPKLIDLSLGRIRRLLADLGDPQLRLPPTIHVAGTNGKGSTVANLRAIGEAAGLRVHAFTSPHLVRFVERIRLAGTLISDEALSDVLARVEAANDGREITFFEITTAAALVAFAETPANLLLLEVGLGGRFDATNVIDPAVSVIAPIDIDHREFLGDTLAAIAGEKTGILKRGRPAVSARQPGEALEVVEREAEAVGAPLMLMGRDFDAWAEGDRLLVQMPDRLLDLPAPALTGPHQIDNAGLAVAAALTLGDPRLTTETALSGVAKAIWPGRLQRIMDGPLGDMAQAVGATLWLDGGHNPHAGRALALALERMKARDGRPIALVAGMLANKDAAGFFAPFAALDPPVVAISFDGNAAPAEQIAQAARAAGLTAKTAPDVTLGLAQALAAAPGGHVLICGSLHLVGEVLGLSPETWPV